MFQSQLLSLFFVLLTGCAQESPIESVYTPADCAQAKPTDVGKETKPDKPNALSKSLPEKTAVTERAKKTAVAEQAKKTAVTEQAKKTAVTEQAKKAAVTEQAQKTAVAEQAQKQINVNTATETELEKLPGVGPALAKRIVAYRTKRPFKRIRDIRRVKGIGPAKFAKMKDLLALE